MLSFYGIFSMNSIKFCPEVMIFAHHTTPIRTNIRQQSFQSLFLSIPTAMSMAKEQPVICATHYARLFSDSLFKVHIRGCSIRYIHCLVNEFKEIAPIVLFIPAYRALGTVLHTAKGGCALVLGIS